MSYQTNANTVSYEERRDTHEEQDGRTDERGAARRTIAQEGNHLHAREAGRAKAAARAVVHPENLVRKVTSLPFFY